MAFVSLTVDAAKKVAGNVAEAERIKSSIKKVGIFKAVHMLVLMSIQSMFLIIKFGTSILTAVSSSLMLYQRTRAESCLGGCSEIKQRGF
jgi:hypothetical protein